LGTPPALRPSSLSRLSFQRAARDIPALPCTSAVTLRRRSFRAHESPLPSPIALRPASCMPPAIRAAPSSLGVPPYEQPHGSLGLQVQMPFPSLKAYRYSGCVFWRSRLRCRQSCFAFRALHFETQGMTSRNGPTPRAQRSAFPSASPRHLSAPCLRHLLPPATPPHQLCSRRSPSPAEPRSSPQSHRA